LSGLVKLGSTPLMMILSLASTVIPPAFDVPIPSVKAWIWLPFDKDNIREFNSIFPLFPNAVFVADVLILLLLVRDIFLSLD